MLILYLSLVNKHVWKTTVKFEDLRIALTYIKKNEWMIKWDIHSAYHHILLNSAQTYGIFMDFWRWKYDFYLSVFPVRLIAFARLLGL